MKAQKVTLKVEVDTLDIDSAKGLLLQMINNIDSGSQDGMLSMGDGDKITWNTSKKDVSI